MAKSKVFLDTSVLITAVLSSRGGSFYILNSLQDACEFYTNEYVLDEALAVIDGKFSSRPDLKHQLFLLVGTAPIRVVSNPSQEDTQAAARILNAEDAPILASALRFCSYLVTLDNDFLQRDILDFASRKGVAIVKPKEFILHLRGNSL